MKKVMAKIRNKFKRHSIKFCIITIIIINNIYFWSDYFNIPSKLINVNNINLSLLIAVLNNSVTERQSWMLPDLSVQMKTTNAPQLKIN